MIKRYFEFIKESPDYKIEYSDKFDPNWKGGIIQGELPTDEWLNILCESLDDELNIELIDNRLHDAIGRLVHEADAIYILKNKVYVCIDIHIFGEKLVNGNMVANLLDSDKLDIIKIEKKIQAEGYRVLLTFNFGTARLIIYPK